MRSLLLLASLLLFFVAPIPNFSGAHDHNSGSVLLPETLLSQQSLPTTEAFSELIQTDPVAALRIGLLRYQRQIQKYHCQFLKQERISGVLYPEELIDVDFREQPFSVLMRWRKGSRNFAEGSLYVAGENQGRMMVWLPRLLNRKTPVATRDFLARRSSRYALDEFGIYCGMLRTFTAWQQRQKQGVLQWKFKGIQEIPELRQRKCYVIERTCSQPEWDSFVLDELVAANAHPDDAFSTVTIMIDCENWLQVGSVLTRSDGEIIARYFFRDLDFAPQFHPKTFSIESFR